jgi:hypothetical protein
VGTGTRLQTDIAKIKQPPKQNEVATRPWSGQRVLLWGGTPRAERHKKLEKKFGLTIDWPEAGDHGSIKHGTVEAYVNRTKNGEWPLVMYIVPLCSHTAFSQLKAACSASGTIFRPLRSYGTGQVAQALKEAFPEPA